MFKSIYRSVSCSATIREASLCSRWKLTQRPTIAQVLTTKDCLQCEDTHTHFSVGCLLKSLPSEARELCKRGGKMIVRARGSGWHQRNVSSETTGVMYIVTETVAKGPSQLQSRQGPNVDTERQTQLPLPNQETIFNWHLLAKEKNRFLQWNLS